MSRAFALPAVLALAACAALVPAAPARAAEPLQQMWVYTPTNMLVNQNVDKLIALIGRSAKAGYNGILLADSKFTRWDSLDARYAANVARVRQACRDAKMDCVAALFSIGYSNDLLSRDVNLAAALSVRDAPFVVRGGKLVPEPIPAGQALVNGSFEKSRNNQPAGWSFVDAPGKITFIDTAAPLEGQACLRMQDIGKNDPHGHGRASQALQVEPFRNYHISVAIKTKDFDARRDVRIAVIGEGGLTLNYHMPPIQRTQDWKRIDVTFNSLACQKVQLYLGVWGGKGGTIWWDDCRLEPAGLVNIVRRPGASVRVVSEDGQTTYQEGKDFAELCDPKLGNDPWKGNYNAWHDVPGPTIPSGSRLKEGQRVLLSYYHTVLIYQEQVGCCMSEPKLYDILTWQAAQVHKHVQPDGYMMSHDEIRVHGWCAACEARKMTSGQMLADNVKRCVEILDKEDAGRPIYTWSDMFDPFHNAAPKGPYYLVKGDGPWSGSWEGLPAKVTVLNWNSDPKKRVDSLKHFAARGNKQILAGYYDGDPAAIRPWLRDAAGVPGVTGVMYTTWANNYSDLEKFIQEVKKERALK